MAVTGNVNLGTIIPVGMFLVGQTVAAVWWAGQISQNMDNLSSEVAALKVDLEDAVSDAEDVQLRQWARINTNEERVIRLEATEAAITARFDAFGDAIRLMREDLRANSDLLRDLSSAVARNTFKAGEALRE